MKSLLVATTAAVLLTLGAMTAAASSSTTPASGGTNVSADLAQNGVAPAFATLGAVVISEASNNDFKTSGTLVLTSPSGWRFNTAAAITATPGKVGGGSTPIDISASVGAITASSITINITVNAAARLDNLTLGGIQVQAIEGGALPAAGNILRSSVNAGTATIVGVINDVTNFGSLSLASGALRLHVVLPGQSFVDGSTVASSGIIGVAASQAAGVSFNLVELVAADRQFNVATYSGAKTVAYSGAGGSPSYTTSVSFSGGHSTTPLATTLRKAETVALSATSATSPAIGTGLASSSFAVAPGPVSKLQILLPGETAAPGTSSGKTGAPTAQIAGVAIVNNVRVNAVDADWNVISGAAADVAISSSDVAAAIDDDNGAAGGNLTLAAGSGALSTFSFGTGGGPQTVTASDVAAALSAGASASVTVNKPAPATSLDSSHNPAFFGQSVTLTATVTGGGGTPTGTVNFKDGSTVIGSALPLDDSGVASFTTSSLSVATHAITAVYGGSAYYTASTSANLSQIVSKASTATALASSLNPSCAGQPVTLTATVGAVAPGSGVPALATRFRSTGRRLRRSPRRRCRRPITT
ncbi:MAG: Ig-like domain repeat protein [Candidatus Eisenbacteria bacterium]|uniref:Ig-like domain repeat protein n=1 Tax=Eiseniibacteriota bacterium TaxID=2212470 RepID=A0A538TA67_UNCEI|nr:MAG: Ig-like domain repeat protein [Candidatus Eisenbacteria bacterium]